MGTAAENRAEAAQLPEGDVVRILLEQHARIRDLFEEVTNAAGTQRQQAFDHLRALLAVHETAEELVLRPLSSDIAGTGVADSRNQEEAEATRMLADLEKMDVASDPFTHTLATFRTEVERHADAEEDEEFPQIISRVEEEERIKLGKRLQAAEAIAPTHPHPSTAGSPAAQAALGPFASLVDRARDAIMKQANR